MATIDGGGYYPSPERTRKVVTDEDDDYPPYAQNVVQMTREAHADERRGMDALVIILAGIVAGVALGLLLVVYGLF